MERKKKAELELYKGGKNQIIVDPAQPSHDVKGLPQGSAWPGAGAHTHTFPEHPHSPTAAVLP